MFQTALLPGRTSSSLGTEAFPRKRGTLLPIHATQSTRMLKATSRAAQSQFLGLETAVSLTKSAADGPF